MSVYVAVYKQARYHFVFPLCISRNHETFLLLTYPINCFFFFFQNGMIITVILITWMTLRVWPAAPKWDCLRHAVPMALWESGTRPIDCCVSSNWMPLLPAFVSVVRKVTWSWVLANIFTKSATLLVSVQRVLKVLRNRFIATTVLDYFMTSLFWLFHCSPS